MTVGETIHHIYCMIHVPSGSLLNQDHPGFIQPRLRSGRLVPRLAGIILLFLGVSASHAQLQVIRQGRDSANTAESNDGYGHALTVGDFNGDGYDDVAVGSPGEGTGLTPTSARTGAVIVSWGGPWGISWESARQLFPSDSPEVGLGAIDFGFGGRMASVFGRNRISRATSCIRTDGSVRPLPSGIFGAMTDTLTWPSAARRAAQAGCSW
jgi:hypothetical protein